MIKGKEGGEECGAKSGEEGGKRRDPSSALILSVAPTKCVTFVYLFLDDTPEGTPADPAL